MSLVDKAGTALPANRPARLGKWLKAGAATAAGSALIGSGVVTHIDNHNQAQQIDRLNGQLAQSHFAAKNMSSQLTELNKELSTRITLDQIADVIGDITPSAVRVEGPFGLGSGVIINTEQGRFILTNAHVTENNEFNENVFQDGVFKVKLYNGTDFTSPVEFNAPPVILSNGERAISHSGEHDLALLQIPPNVQLPPGAGISVRDLTSDPLRVGEPVIVVGNPFGERDSVAFGIISHVDREASTLNINHHIQVDAPINPGNSGGGAFDMQGRLIGINTWGYRGGDGVGGSIRMDEIVGVFNGWGITPQVQIS